LGICVDQYTSSTISLLRQRLSTPSSVPNRLHPKLDHGRLRSQLGMRTRLRSLSGGDGGWRAGGEVLTWNSRSEQPFPHPKPSLPPSFAHMRPCHFACRTTLKTLSHLEMGGLIDLKTPDVELGIFEEFNSPTPGWSEVPRGVVIQSRLVFFGILVSLEPFQPSVFLSMLTFVCSYLAPSAWQVTHSLARPLITHYSLKTRAHIGNTSMDAEISLLMANQALSRPGALCWDPFVGRSSFSFLAASSSPSALQADGTLIPA
jgi:hypothetical protein